MRQRDAQIHAGIVLRTTVAMRWYGYTATRAYRTGETGNREKSKTRSIRFGLTLNPCNIQDAMGTSLYGILRINKGTGLSARQNDDC